MAYLNHKLDHGRSFALHGIPAHRHQAPQRVCWEELRIVGRLWGHVHEYGKEDGWLIRFFVEGTLSCHRLLHPVKPREKRPGSD